MKHDAEQLTITEQTGIPSGSRVRDYSEGTLLGFFNKMGNALVVGILFLACSIPVITLGTSATAAYYAMMKSVRCERSYPVKEFFSAFKRNLLKGILYTVALLLIGAVLGFDLFYAGALKAAGMEAGRLGDGSNTVISIAYGICAAFTAVFALWIFPVISRFDISVKRTVILTFTIAVKYFYFTLALAAIAAVSAVLIWKLSVGFILVIPAAVFYGATYIIEPAFRHYIQKPEEGEDDWYYTGK